MDKIFQALIIVVIIKFNALAGGGTTTVVEGPCPDTSGWAAAQDSLDNDQGDGRVCYYGDGVPAIEVDSFHEGPVLVRTPLTVSKPLVVRTPPNL